MKIPESVILEINHITPEALEAHNVITPAKTKANGRSTYICPFCGNGTGKSGDGLAVKEYSWGYGFTCFKENKSYNNFDLLGVYYNLDKSREFVELCLRACADFGIFLSVDETQYRKPARQFRQNTPPAAPITPPPKKEKTAEEIAKEQDDAEKAQKKIEMIRADLSQPDNLFNYPDEKYCGLNMESLRKFSVIYVKKWLPIWARLKNKNATPTPRMLFPAGNHYLARLTVPLENYKNARDFEFIKEKPHEGQKHPFGIWTITAATKYLIVVEGEKDCISIWQALNIIFEGNEILETVSVVATCSAITGGAVANEIVDCIKNFKLLEKIKVLIIFDNDDTGEKDAPELRKYFLGKEISAVYDFLPTHEDGTKRDANDILIEGDDNSITGTAGEIELAILIYDMINRNENKWLDAIAEINALCYENAKKAAEKNQKSEKEKINQLLYLPHSDLGNARRIKIMYGDIIRFDTEREIWGFYENDVWKFATSSSSALYPFTQKIADAIEKHKPERQTPTLNSDGSIDPNFEIDEEKAKKISLAEKLQRSWQKIKTQRNAIELLKGVPEILIRSKELDAHPNLINCKNGVVVDLRTGKYFPTAPELYLTQQAGANYNPEWQADDDHKVEKFLRDILPNKNFRQFLLRWIGYCITGEVNEEKFLFIKGRGGNGKGTLTKILLKMLGDYGCSFPIGGILYRKTYDANAATTAINILENKRLAFGEEIPPNAKVDSAQIKILTGGDIVPARKNYSEYRNIAPTWKLTFSGNNDLIFPDATDYGIKRRFFTIPFTADFTGENADLTLKSALLEQSALDYFFNKLIRQAGDWYKEGLQIPDEIKAAADDYLHSQDFIAEFIAENCEYCPDGVITRKDFVDKLFESYPREIPKNQNNLTEMMKKIDGVEYKRVGGTYKLFGIKKGEDW